MTRPLNGQVEKSKFPVVKTSRPLGLNIDISIDSESRVIQSHKAMTITCYLCKGTCTGEVLKVQEKHFHINCFACKVCGRLLASGGYFMKNDNYYCSRDYHIEFGTKCKTCGDYVEGRVVTALGNSYHPKCFNCNRCSCEIHSGTVVTYNDRQEILCQKCTDIAINDGAGETARPSTASDGRSSESNSRSGDTENRIRNDDYDQPVSYTRDRNNASDQLNDLFDFTKVPDVDPVTRTRMGKCAGCGESIRSSQSLIALDSHWHLFCFTCSVCNKLLTTEYMTKKEKPFCESCYQDSFGVTCSGCRRFITGKVLEAGEKSFHPSCASCCKCGVSFGEGEDMCISGEDIWHLDCDRVDTGACDSETSSEDSRSQSRTRSFTSPSPTGLGQRSHSKILMSRESSAGEPLKECAIYPLKDLQLIGSMRLPRDVNRTKLEQHLTDEDFQRAFGFDRNTFYTLQMWKQIDLKKRANLF